MKIIDVAKRVNVSPSTVSRVLNNSDSVNKETREKVLAALKETGYVPNLIARGLRTSSRTIAIIVQDILNPYYTEALYAADKVCRENGYALTVINSNNSRSQEHENLIQAISMKVCGVIFLANIQDEYSQILRQFSESKIAAITMEGVIDGIDSVVSDCRPGVREAMEYLLSMGHRKIGMCHGSMRTLPIISREREMRQYLLEKGCPFDESCKFFGDDYLEQLDRARKEKRLPSALFTINDNTAVNVYRWCKSVSLKIPEDISILGFDDIPLADILSPSLTTIAQPIGYLAELAMKQLISRIRNKEELMHPCNISVPTRLVKRQSIKKLL